LWQARVRGDCEDRTQVSPLDRSVNIEHCQNEDRIGALPDVCTRWPGIVPERDRARLNLRRDRPAAGLSLRLVAALRRLRRVDPSDPDDEASYKRARIFKRKSFCLGWRDAERPKLDATVDGRIGGAFLPQPAGLPN
jgi:hypothetical protein